MIARAANDPALAAALARIAVAPRLGQLGTDRAVVRRCTGLPADETMLVRLGARALAPHVDATWPLRRQLAQRLPRALGLAVYGELRAHADGDAPAWSALTR
jgi:hypothetical protein